MKKNILFVISNINIGGPQKSLLALLDKIDYSIFNVDIISIESNGELKKYYNDNVEFIETPELLYLMTIPIKNTLSSLYKLLTKKYYSLLFDIILSLFKHLFLKKSMNQERQQIWKKYSKLLSKLDKKYDIAIGALGGISTYYIVDCVNADFRYHWIISDSRILNRNIQIDTEYYEQLSGAISVSERCTKIFINVFPTFKSKIFTFYNIIPIGFYNQYNVDLHQIIKYKNSIKILTVCRLDPLKGLDMAIKACKILVDNGYEIKWFVLGDGKYKQDVINMINNANLTDSFLLLGFQYNIIAFIEQCDIFVHPSRTEGKSNAVDEAKYAGKPIIVTNYDTVQDQIENGVTGIICEMNESDIANSIIAVAAHTSRPFLLT